MDKLSDRALARRCAALEELAWRELLRRHERRLSRALLHWLGPRGAAEVEDLRQDVYLRLLAHGRAALSGLRAERPGALARFLKRVAHRVVLDHRAAQRGVILEELTPARPPLALIDQPFDLLEDRRRHALFSRALERVAQGPTAARDLLVLRAHFLEGRAPAEIALLPLGLAEDGVEGLIRRARARIADRLRGEPVAEGLAPPRRSGSAA